MRLLKLSLGGYRSIERLEFDAGPFTVLFGKNNAGKTVPCGALVPITAGQPSSRCGGDRAAKTHTYEPPTKASAALRTSS